MTHQNYGYTEAEFCLTLLDEFPALIWRANLQGECDWFNTTWLDFTGRTLEQEIGNGWAEGVHPEDLGYCTDIWQKNFATQTPFVMDYRLRQHDGEYRWIRDYGRPFNDMSGEFGGYIGVCYDITETVELTAQLEYLAAHDSLTGLPNRRSFEAEVSNALAMANRGIPSWLMYADVDRFKTCNDTNGHTFGDRVLQEIAQALRASVREVDFVARVGGDEFGLLLRSGGPESVDEATSRIKEAVRAIGEKLGVDIGMSVGATPVAAGANFDKIVQTADQKMYEDKARRNS